MRTFERRRRCAYIILKFHGKIMRKVRHRRFVRNRRAVIKIQSWVRRCLARIKFSMIRKMRAVSNTSLLVFKLRLKMKIIRRRKDKETYYAEKRMERLECDKMSQEEAFMKQYMVDYEAESLRQHEYHKRVVAEMARQEEMRKVALEHKRNKAAIVIQAYCRGLSARMHLDDYVLKGNNIHTVSRFRNGRRISSAGVHGYEALASLANREEKTRLRNQVLAALKFRQARGYISKEDLALLEAKRKEQEEAEMHAAKMAASPAARAFQQLRNSPAVAANYVKSTWNHVLSRKRKMAVEEGRRRASLARVGLLDNGLDEESDDNDDDDDDDDDDDEGRGDNRNPKNFPLGRRERQRQSILQRKTLLTEKWKQEHRQHDLPPHLQALMAYDIDEEDSEEDSNDDSNDNRLGSSSSSDEDDERTPQAPVPDAWQLVCIPRVAK